MGPVRSDRERTSFFPSHYVPSGLRSVTGRTLEFFPESERTGPPVGGRPHSTARELPGGRARRALAGRGDMNDVAGSAVDKMPIRRIRQSTRCQQKEQLMLWLLSAAAVIGNQAASQHIADARVPEHACGSNTPWGWGEMMQARSRVAHCKDIASTSQAEACRRHAGRAAGGAGRWSGPGPGPARAAGAMRKTPQGRSPPPRV